MTTTRLLSVDDAPELAELSYANRDFLAPWEPTPPPDAWEVSTVRATIAVMLRGHADGVALPLVILDGDRIVGRITLGNIVRGVLQSGTVGYWVAEADNGRGHASAAVAEMCELAFGQLALHRVEAGTLVHNVRSQAVLARNGFERYGLAPRYLKIDGRWQDHILFQRLGAEL